MARRTQARLAAVTLRAGIGTALIGLAAACGTSVSSGHAAGSGAVILSSSTATITETGSSLLYPLARKWAAAYHQAKPDVTVSTVSASSGVGIAAASAGTVDIGASDAYLSSGDLVKSHHLLNIPLVISAQTVIYNVPGLSPGSHINLTGQILAEIYDGTIKTWDDTAIKKDNKNLPLPALPIVPLHRSGSTGDTFLFTSYLSTQDPGWNSSTGYGTMAAWPAVPGAQGEGSSSDILRACASTSGCVAYNGISFLPGALKAHLGYASLANTIGQFTLPTPAAIQASVASFVSLTPPNETIAMIDGPAPTGYPIVNYEYAVVSSHQRDAGTASALRSFLRWVLISGNQASYLSDLGFQPLPSPLVALGEQQIAGIGP